MVRLGLIEATIKIHKLKKLIIKLEIILTFKSFLLILDFKNKNINWCKCLLSGLNGDFAFINFLNKENKFPKQGYHNNNII